MALSTLKGNYGAVGNGSTNDAAALASVPAGQGTWVEAGTYQVNSNITINGHLLFAPGAVLRPASGVTIQWAPGASVWAGNYVIFDGSQGGSFNGYNLTGWASSSWFQGGSSRDLGVQLNNALKWGFNQIDIPPAPDHVIRTTVKLVHAAVIRCQWHGFPRHVVCRTANKPVFEAIGDIRHWRIIGGVFDGDTTATPSCFLLCASDDAGMNQCGDTTALSETHVTGSWGVGCVVNIGCEVLVFQNVALWIQGKGDSPWTGPQSAVTIANADYWGVPFTYTKPITKQRSCSAMLFDNCDLRGGRSGAGQTILLKGRVEDIDFKSSYYNGQGKACIVAEAGKILNPDNGQVEWNSPRSVHVWGGRFETQGAPASGIPFVLVDAINTEGASVDSGLYGLTIGHMGFFVGYQSNSTPIVKTVNGAILDNFVFNQGGQIAWTNKLLEHKTKDLYWANIRAREQVDVDCTGRTLYDCEIRVGGNIQGTLGAGTVVKSDNQSNWTGGSGNPPPPPPPPTTFSPILGWNTSPLTERPDLISVQGSNITVTRPADVDWPAFEARFSAVPGASYRITMDILDSSWITIASTNPIQRVLETSAAPGNQQSFTFVANSTQMSLWAGPNPGSSSGRYQNITLTAL